MSDLNPFLTEVRVCPRCGSGAVETAPPRSLRCPDCGLRAYFNPKPVACAIPREPDGSIWLLRRGFAPGEGRWTFPGGFVDLGETVEAAAIREVREELCVDVELGALIGLYSRPDDRILLVVYDARIVGGVPQTTPEAVEVRRFAAGDVPWDELAFWSTERALRDVVDRAPTP